MAAWKTGIKEAIGSGRKSSGDEAILKSEHLGFRKALSSPGRLKEKKGMASIFDHTSSFPVAMHNEDGPYGRK